MVMARAAARAALVLVLLAGCQQPGAIRPVPAPVEAPPPRVSPAEAAPAASRAARVAADSAGRLRSAAVITLHLAQERSEPSLMPVDVGGPHPLYALPQPMLTQVDIDRVAAVTQRGGRTFLLLEMTPRGSERLRDISRQAAGNYLLLSVQGQLVAVSRIAASIEDGRLLIATRGPQHTRAILQLMENP